jgi:UDP-GlcNAc:undecaprenyl-phosphate GlcNAc-1-phosphate transferase
MTFVAFLHHLAFCAVLAAVSSLMVRAMISARVMDMPDQRKAHRNPTPKGGGVGIVVAFMLGMSVLYGTATFSRIADPYFRGVILASGAIAVVSFVDDVRNWPFTVKLATQILAAGVAVGSGLYVSVYRLPFLGAFDVGWLGVPLTIGWILFATNAMNFIDGLNGLCAGTALVAAGSCISRPCCWRPDSPDFCRSISRARGFSWATSAASSAASCWRCWGWRRPASGGSR